MGYIKRTGATGWSDAQGQCQASGDLGLATIASLSENSVVQTLLAGMEVYIGLSDTATEGTYLWTDGSSPTYTNWATGQPKPGTGATQDCVKMKLDGTWDDVGCNKSTFDFICEKMAS